MDGSSNEDGIEDEPLPRYDGSEETEGSVEDMLAQLDN